MGASSTEFDAEYGADQIQILEGLEAVRKRPGMYIGSTSSRGLHHLVYEIVDNSVDEALAGYCDEIQVDINKDNYLMIGDSLSSDIKGAKNAKIDAFWIHQNINDDKGLPMGDDLLTFYTWLKRPKLV